MEVMCGVVVSPKTTVAKRRRSYMSGVTLICLRLCPKSFARSLLPAKWTLGGSLGGEHTEMSEPVCMDVIFDVRWL